jgi:hypothetical protein
MSTMYDHKAIEASIMDALGHGPITYDDGTISEVMAVLVKPNEGGFYLDAAPDVVIKMTITLPNA